MDQSFTSISSYLILIFLLTCNPTTTSSTYLENSPLHNEGACALVNCVEGTCLLSVSSILGFECQCFPGWKKLFPFPTCSVPNCTVEFGCGDGAQPPPPNPLPPFFNISNPCNVVFCGDGNCIANGTSGHICRCNDGSANMFHNTLLPCVKQCNLGADCRDVGLGGSSQPPSPSTSDSPGNGTPPPQPPTPPGTNGGVSASLKIPSALVVIFFLLAAVLS